MTSFFCFQTWMDYYLLFNGLTLTILLVRLQLDSTVEINLLIYDLCWTFLCCYGYCFHNFGLGPLGFTRTNARVTWPLTSRQDRPMMSFRQLLVGSTQQTLDTDSVSVCALATANPVEMHVTMVRRSHYLNSVQDHCFIPDRISKQTFLNGCQMGKYHDWFSSWLFKLFLNHYFAVELKSLLNHIEGYVYIWCLLITY